MALAALFWLALAFNSDGWKRWGYGVLVVAASYSILFLVLGRTGYVALVIGLGMWLFFSQGRSQRGALLLFGTIAFPALLLIPNKATNRIIQGVGEIKICMAVSVANVNEACNSSIEGHLFMIFVAILAGYPVSDVQRVKNNYLTQ